MNKELFLYILTRKYRVKNLINLLLKRKGSLILSNGFELKYSKETKSSIIELYLFSAKYGAEFSEKEGFWNFDFDDNLVITPNGIKFKLERFDSGIFSETFLHDIHYSEALRGKIVIQAGGFIGDTALYYASKGAKVYSFEPEPNSYKLALDNIKLNPELSNNIVMINYAIGKDEFIDFPVNEYGSVGAGGASAYILKGYKTIKTRSISITKLLEEFKINTPFLLDLDIKGKEFDIINDNNISKFQKIRIEYSPDLVGLKENGRDILIDKIKGLGFSDIRVFKHSCGWYDLHYHGTIYASK